MPAEAMAEVGPVDLSVVGYGDGGEMRLVTAESRETFQVEASGYVDGEVPPGATPDLLGQIVEAAGAARTAAEAAEGAAADARAVAGDASFAAERAGEAADGAEAAKGAADAAAEAANGAAELAGSSASAAEAAARNANGAAQAVRTNILTGTAGGAVAHAEDAHPGAVLRQVKVKGLTRQNLFPAFRSGSSFGIDYTANDDGSCTVSGTSTDEFSRIDLGCFYSLKPGTSYSMLTEGFENNETYPFVQFYKDGSIIKTNVESQNVKNFTSPESFDYARAFINGAGSSGKTVNKTVRVMLSEGAEPAPWCPPGVHSVGELGVATSGKNLLSDSLEGKGPSNVSGVPYLIADFGRNVQINAVITAYTSSLFMHGAYGVAFYDFRKEDGTHGYATNGDVFKVFSDNSAIDDGSYSYDVSSKTFRYIYCYLTGVGNGYGQFSGNVKIQLEYGSKSTDYEPPAVTETVHDLEGHALRSLPDGACDALVWLADGTRSIDERCIAITFGGSENWTYSSDYDAFQLTKPNIPDVDFSVSNVLCDKYSVCKTGVTTVKDKQFALSGGANAIYVKDSAFGQDASAFKASLAASPMACVFARAASEAPLAPAPMPTQPSTTLNVWASSGAGLSPEVEAVYERDLTTAYDNLAARIAALNVKEATNV